MATLAGVLGLSCHCEPGGKSSLGLDEAGMFHEYPVRYELHVEGNAASATVNGAEVIVCDTFSENCAFADLPQPLPRLRHHESSAELTAYLRPGRNRVRVQVRPDGDDDAPAKYRLLRKQQGSRTRTLAEGEVPVDLSAGNEFTVDIASDCSQPPLPELDWVERFLGPYPEAQRVQQLEAFASFLVPVRNADEALARKERFERFREVTFVDYPFPVDSVRQTPEDVPLVMNYSCENERLFVYPEDGGYLSAFVVIERHTTGPVKGTSSQASLVDAVALAYWEGSWYLAEPF
ncbi:MAG: hypothetical protein AAGA54_22325 [Myxococcota bacterium]